MPVVNVQAGAAIIKRNLSSAGASLDAAGARMSDSPSQKKQREMHASQCQER